MSFPDTVIEAAARAAHEANRAYCLAIGDTSQAPWDAAPEWQRRSSMSGVRAVIRGSTPRGLHEAWMADKLRDGWKFGPVKDAEAKTHPRLMEYFELPEAKRRKDALFLGVVKAILHVLRPQG